MRAYLANPQDAAAKAAFDAYNADVELIRADGVAARQKAILVRAAIEWEVLVTQQLLLLRKCRPSLMLGLRLGWR